MLLLSDAVIAWVLGTERSACLVAVFCFDWSESSTDAGRRKKKEQQSTLACVLGLEQ